ncbi:SdpA family antimicrobial peptide system protein [Pseudonocardia sp. ICBG601]|uniref:SdpA family antimicrobial peptide system protein n=1 Tax=Pseudonocardia sp. ICBG601 TaxID=2846759 RepID=UPI0035ABD3C6
MRRIEVPARHRVALAAVLCLGVLLSTLSMAVFFALPSNVVSWRDGGAVRKIVASALPEGWAFFTKPPNDPEYVPIYSADGGRTFEGGSSLPNSRFENWYGLLRSQRAQGPEIANLSNEPLKWQMCENKHGSACYKQVWAGSPTFVRNSSPVPTVCGRAIVMETRPVPWAFRDFYKEVRENERGALVEVTC